ncbi:MAG: hypothetical protein K0S29_369 [Gammaproteobacteria bacterium]|jgi:predicted metal-dependent hydrolase|nr:hypothetical protein [Gammaproteobacteria bacterium]
MQQFEFSHENYRFFCTLQLARRKSIMLRVKPDSSLLIKAPLSTSLQWIESIILKKANWIVTQQKALEQKQLIAKQRFSQGSICYYLGKAYTLQIKQAESESIALQSADLILHSSGLDNIETLLKDWYKAEASQLFLQRLHYCYQLVEQLKLPFPKALRIKALKSRWGSCGLNQKISLNIELIQYPIECIDYVIIHELCHLREMNHGPGFYALMDKAMADWQLHRHNLRIYHKTMPSLLA